MMGIPARTREEQEQDGVVHYLVPAALRQKQTVAPSGYSVDFASSAPTTAVSASLYAAIYRGGAPEDRGAQKSEYRDMDDNKDVQRLEDRIAASEERSQLRLEKMMERVDGALARITDQTTAIRQELQEQRADSRVLRSEVAQAVVSIRTELSEQLSVHRTTERTHFHWVMGTMIVGWLGLAAIVFGAFQLWSSGVQVGEAAHPSAQGALPALQPSAPTTPIKP
jgi:hypothetical protein